MEADEIGVGVGEEETFEPEFEPRDEDCERK
jgi:hypothetical protein